MSIYKTVAKNLKSHRVLHYSKLKFQSTLLDNICKLKENKNADKNINKLCYF